MVHAGLWALRHPCTALQRSKNQISFLAGAIPPADTKPIVESAQSNQEALLEEQGY